jgi:hypothetical protein
VIRGGLGLAGVMVACLTCGCGPEQEDPLQGSRDAWKAQQQTHQEALREAQRQQAELMRDLGVGGP